MAQRTPHVTETELAILDVLWQQGSAVIREIAARLYGEDYSTIQYTTVKSLLERLESKKYVVRDRSGFAHVFAAKVGRDAFIGQQLDAMANRICGGSLAPLLMNLVERLPLTKRERDRLKNLIDEGG